MWEALRCPTWFDEVYTLLVARGSPASVLHSAARDVHPPLFYLVVWAWRSVGGESEPWLKTLPILFGLATVALVVPVGRQMLGARAAWLAALVLALHRSHVYYSQELRFYAFLWLLQLATAWLAWRWIRSGGGRDAIGFVLCAAASLYTHYHAALVLAPLAVWGVVALRRDPRRLGLWILLFAAVGILFAPQVPTLLQQMGRNRGSSWIGVPDLARALDLPRQLCFGAWYLVLPLALLAALPLGKRETRAQASLLWTLTVVPPVVAWVLSQRGLHIYLERYFFAALPFWCLLMAAGVAQLPRAWMRFAATVILPALALRSLLLHQPLPEARVLTRALEQARASTVPGELVLHAESHSLLFFMKHLPDRQNRLLMATDQPLPYYEGEAVLPDSLRLTVPALDAERAGGRAWCGVRFVRPLHGAAEAESLAVRASAAAQDLGGAKVWAGNPAGAARPPRASTGRPPG